MMGIIEIIQTIVLSCIITVGWCLMFTLPKAIHHALHDGNSTWFWFKTSDGNFGVHLVVATFFGAMAGSFLGVHFAQRHGLPPKALIVPLA